VDTNVWYGNLQEGYNLKNPGADERITLKWIFDE
jgi:hypothetical protein